eukprot:4947815-Prymnesium_polylepis.2
MAPHRRGACEATRLSQHGTASRCVCMVRAVSAAGRAQRSCRRPVRSGTGCRFASAVRGVDVRDEPFSSQHFMEHARCCFARRLEE